MKPELKNLIDVVSDRMVWSDYITLEEHSEKLLWQKNPITFWLIKMFKLGCIFSARIPNNNSKHFVQIEWKNVSRSWGIIRK